MGAEQMKSACAVVNHVAQVAEAAISPEEVFQPLTAPISDTNQRELLRVEMLTHIDKFEALKPKLRGFSLAPKAFFQFTLAEGWEEKG